MKTNYHLNYKNIETSSLLCSKKTKQKGYICLKHVVNMAYRLNPLAARLLVTFGSNVDKNEMISFFY